MKRKRELVSIAICALLVGPVFSGAIYERGKEIYGISSVHSPDKCAFSGVGINLDNQLVTSAIGLPTGTLYLAFQTKYEIKSNSTDFGYVKISSDGGSTWNILRQFQGSQPDWTYLETDLSSYAGGTVQILFEYITGPDPWHSFDEGWYIDRIFIEKDGIALYSEYFEQYYIGMKFGDWTVVKKQSAIDIEYITIGDRSILCYSFAIFADPQVGGGDISKLQAAVDEVIALNNDLDPNNDIEFVIGMGDFIQGEGVSSSWKGETEYRQEYQQVVTELERLEIPRPIGAGIHYIPVIGNHDVWCKYGDYVLDDGPPDYPEELFADYFDAQYNQLSADLDGWTDQRGSMPITNPYQGLHPPYMHLQNFAFDYGPYHFICLDFCAREDFDPFAGLSVKKFWGYADLHDVDESNNVITNGTWDWLNGHLEECRNKGIKDVFIFTHHPPVYELDTAEPAEIKIPESPNFMPFSSSTGINGAMHIVDDPTNNLDNTTLTNYYFFPPPGFDKWDNKVIHDRTTVDRMEGDAVFGFNKETYDREDEYDKLANLFSSYNINIVHWFSGHYHLKGFNWFDTNIGANISAIPSIMTAKDIYRINFTGNVQINELSDAVIAPGENPNGCFTIVQVMCPKWADWPLFHHNQQRTGVASGSGIVTDTTTFKWAYPPLNEPSIGAVCGSPVVGPDGTIYFSSTDEYLYALNPDGTLKWRSESLNGRITSSPALLPSTSISPSRGRIYIGTHGDPNFFAIDTVTGKKIWELQVPTGTPSAIEAGSSPLLVVDPVGGEPVLYVGAANGYLYCIRDRGGNGDVVWGTQLFVDSAFAFQSSPAESAVGPMGMLWTIYCGGQETSAGPDFGKGKLSALNPYSGNVIWGIVLTGFNGYVSSPSIEMVEGVETIFAGTSEGRMKAVAVESGQPVEKMHYCVPAGIAVCPAIYDLNGDKYVEVIFGADNGVIYAITYVHDSNWPRSSFFWDYSIGGTIRSSPAVALAQQPTVFIGGCSSSGNIYSIMWDGTLLGYYTTQTPELCISSSPAVAERLTDLIGAPGWVFVGSCDSLDNPSEGRLYAFGPPGRYLKVPIRGIFSTFNLHYDVVELYIRVHKEDYSDRIYEIKILPEYQQPRWKSIEVLETPEGWSCEKIGNGVRFYTETNPLLLCQGVKFKFRVKAERRISWYLRIHVTDQDHQDIGMIVTMRWLYRFYLV